MDSFFAYSHDTAANHHQFPRQLTDIHGRIFSIESLSSQYRLFVIALDRPHHYDFISSLVETFKAHVNDVRFLILCPSSSQVERYPPSPLVRWIMSVPLAKQLQLYRTDECYRGPFLLQVHANGYWQLVRQLDPQEDWQWLTCSLTTTRHECEQQAQATLCQPIKVKSTKITIHNASWGWPVCPLEIKYAILDQMRIPDILQCMELDEVVVLWLGQRLAFYRKHLARSKDIPLALLESHQRQLAWLVFQLHRFHAIE